MWCDVFFGRLSLFGASEVAPLAEVIQDLKELKLVVEEVGAEQPQHKALLASSLVCLESGGDVFVVSLLSLLEDILKHILFFI